MIAQFMEKRRVRFYESLREDIREHANQHNQAMYERAINFYYNEFQDVSGYVLLGQWLIETVISRIEIDFKEELGI